MRVHTSCPGRLQAGLTLVEAVVAISVIAITLMIALPAIAQARRSTALQLAAHQLGGQLTNCRAFSIFHRRTTALVFDQTDGGAWSCSIFEDGDNDGVRHDDMAAGRDRKLRDTVELQVSGAGLGILSQEQVPDPSGQGWLEGTDPVRAGSSDIISFTPLGTATPSTIYLTDHHSQMRALRVLGATGRIRSLVWRSGWARWKQQWW